jgi:uncharacterized membrane protein
MTDETHKADERRLITVATVVYALQAAGFLFGVTWIVAVIIDYVKRDDAAGTWLESHFRWQIRTFWWALLWGVIGGILFIVIVGWFILMADAIWIIYRIVKGWLRLSERREVA